MKTILALLLVATSAFAQRTITVSRTGTLPPPPVPSGMVYKVAPAPKPTTLLVNGQKLTVARAVASVVPPPTTGVIINPHINPEGQMAWTARQAAGTELVIEVSTNAVGPWRVYDVVEAGPVNRTWGYSVNGPPILFVRGHNISGGAFRAASNFVRPEWVSAVNRKQL